jgi:hypothetical protein
MSAVEGDRIHGHNGSSAPDRAGAPGPTEVDVPGILAGQVADLYATSERERRKAVVERAIARARGSA